MQLHFVILFHHFSKVCDLFMYDLNNITRKTQDYFASVYGINCTTVVRWSLRAMGLLLVVTFEIFPCNLLCPIFIGKTLILKPYIYRNFRFPKSWLLWQISRETFSFAEQKKICLHGNCHHTLFHIWLTKKRKSNSNLLEVKLCIWFSNRFWKML